MAKMVHHSILGKLKNVLSSFILSDPLASISKMHHLKRAVVNSLATYRDLFTSILYKTSCFKY